MKVLSYFLAATITTGCTAGIAGSRVRSGVELGDGKWVQHHSDAGAYQADYPGDPEVERSEVPTRLGTVVLLSERFTVPAGRSDVSYSVGYFDLPGQVTASRDQLIAIARRNFVSEPTHLLSDSEITMSGYEGREFPVDRQDGTARAVRVCPAGKRMFYVVA